MGDQKVLRADRLAALIAFGLAAIAPLAATGQTVDGPVPFDAIPADAASPFGGMSISPTRIVLEAGRAGESVTLYNSSDAPVSYRVEDVDLVVEADGAYREVEDGEAADWSARPFVRFAPRQVTLQPGERQSIKFITRARRDTPEGEYRSHVRFSSIPTIAPVEEDADSSNSAEDDRSIAVSVGLDYRITIPLLLRVGELTGGASIVSAERLSGDGGDYLQVQLERTGQKSEYGTLIALDRNGAELGVLRGVSVLPPNMTRNVKLPLHGGASDVRSIEFVEQLSGLQTGEVLARATLPD